MVINVVSKKKITFKMLNDAWFAVAQVFFIFRVSQRDIATVAIRHRDMLRGEIFVKTNSNPRYRIRRYSLGQMHV